MAIGIGSLLLGVVLVVIARVPYHDFFSRRLEVADPAVLLDGYVAPGTEERITCRRSSSAMTDRTARGRR